MLKVLSFEAFIIQTKGLEVGPFWQNSHTLVLTGTLILGQVPMDLTPSFFIILGWDQSEFEILRCILKLLYWTKFHNPKINTCDNTKHYRSLWTKVIEM